jgi:hypothetical protein
MPKDMILISYTVFPSMGGQKTGRVYFNCLFLPKVIGKTRPYNPWLFVAL